MLYLRSMTVGGATLSVDMTKDRNINVRLGPDDEARLNRLCEHYALSISSVMRMLLKQATDALPEPKVPATKATKAGK